MKFYLQYGVPTIMTRITHFYGELEERGAGIAIPYERDALLDAIVAIRSRYDEYSKNIRAYNRDNDFIRYYDEKFAFLRAVTV